MVQTLRKQYPPMDQTLEKCEQLVDDERIRYEALSRDKWLHDQATLKEVFYEKGLVEGLAEGEAKGKAEGLAITARKLKAEGFDNTKIAHLTDLSIEEIKGL